MKNSKIKLVAIAAMMSLAIMSCKSNTEDKEDNLENAKENVNAAQEDVAIAKDELTAARLDSVNQYSNYRKEIDNRLAENDKQIAEIRVKVKMQKASIRAKMDKDLDVLMQKNEDFKMKMKNQKDGIYSEWESFKQSYNTSLDELGKSISEMAQNNMKK